ncbi:hypothetical protein EMIT0158MI4_70179 [Burkholderia ambifaria]
MPRHRARDRKRARRGVVRRGTVARHAARERADRLRRAGRRAGDRRAARCASGARRRTDRERPRRRSGRGQPRRRDPPRPPRGFELSRGAARSIREMGGGEPRVRRTAWPAARSGRARRAAVRDAVDAVTPAYARTPRHERRPCVGALHRAGRVEHRDGLPRDRARGRRLWVPDGFRDRRGHRGRPARPAAARLALGAGGDSCGVSVDAVAVAEGARVHRRNEGADRGNRAGGNGFSRAELIAQFIHKKSHIDFRDFHLTLFPVMRGIAFYRNASILRLIPIKEFEHANRRNFLGKHAVDSRLHGQRQQDHRALLRRVELVHGGVQPGRRQRVGDVLVERERRAYPRVRDEWGLNHRMVLGW